jgi:hypothetical protein
MKLHYLLLITFHLSLFTLKVSGQNKPCNNFDCAYKKAENFLKQAAYQKALDNGDSAEGYLTDTNTKKKNKLSNCGGGCLWRLRRLLSKKIIYSR